MFVSFAVPARRPRRPIWRNLLLCSVALLPIVGSAAQAEDGTLRLLSLNIWNKFKSNPEYAKNFFVGGDWDVLMFQEEVGSNYVNNIPGMLSAAGQGTYKGARNGSTGLISRLDGSVGTVSLTGSGAQGGISPTPSPRGRMAAPPPPSPRCTSIPATSRPSASTR